MSLQSSQEPRIDRAQAWDIAVGEELGPMLTGSTFNATVSNFSAVMEPSLSTAGVIESYGFSVNGCVFQTPG